MWEGELCVSSAYTTPFDWLELLGIMEMHSLHAQKMFLTLFQKIKKKRN